MRAQRAEDEVRTLRTLLRAREQGINSGSLSIIPSTISTAAQIRHGTRNAEMLIKWALILIYIFKHTYLYSIHKIDCFLGICYSLLRDNYMDLNNVAERLDSIQNTELSDDPSDTTDNNVT